MSTIVSEPDKTLDTTSAWNNPRTQRVVVWLARGVWIVLALFSLVTFGVGIRSQYAWLLQYPNTAISFPQWTPQGMAVALNGLGLSVSTFALLQTGLSVLRFLVFGGVGLVLFVKRSTNPFALYVSLLLIMTGTFFGFESVAPASPFFGWLSTLVRVLLLTGTLSLAYLFPDGRFVPRWSFVLMILWFVTLLAAFILAAVFPNGRTPPNQIAWLQTLALAVVLLLFVALILSLGLAQIYRYRYVSNATQRQQSKWFVSALVVIAVALLLGGLILPALFPQVREPTLLGLRYALFTTTLSALMWMLLPLAIAMAILRYRLWELDLLINRTLVYAPMTAMLAGVFAVSSNLLERLFTNPNGQPSDIATVLTTLLVVAVFDPLKRMTQGFVDKYFKEAPEPTKRLRAYSEQVQTVMQVMDVEQSARRLLDETMSAFGAVGGQVIIGAPDAPQVRYARGDWKDKPELMFVLDREGTRYGSLALGARRNGQPYTERDRALLETYLAPVENAIGWAIRAHAQEPEMPE
jgi:hypothetical protein